MALFDKIRGWVRPGGETVDLSSPERIARAADVLEGNGRLAEASVLLAEGVKKFPKASGLRAQHERLERQRLRERIVELTKALQARRDPALALELVRIYRQIGDTVSARRVGFEAIEKFPEYAPLHQALGEIWHEIFDQSATKQDGTTAVHSLERCVKLNPANLPARELLVDLYGKIGAWGKALEQAVAVLAHLRPGLTGRLALEALHHRKPPEEDIDSLLRKFASSREAEAKEGPAPAEKERMDKALALFEELKGRRLAAVIAADGAMREAISNERMDKNILAKSIKGLKLAAMECCSRMSLGGFVMAQIETPEAAAYLKVIPPKITDENESGVWRSDALFVLTNDAARRRDVLARLEHI